MQLSLTKKKWHVPEIVLNKQNVIEHLLSRRGVDAADMQRFLEPRIRDTMSNPYQLKDFAQAVQRVCDAIVSREKIVVIGDYDVDGVSSISLMVNFFRYIEYDVEYFVPHREHDGYGLSISLIDRFYDRLIVTVDCGCSAIDALEYASQKGIEVIVIDHHSMSIIPPAFALINPHRPDESDVFKDQCAAGLVYMFLVALSKKLELEKYRVPDMRCFLDVVALATVCDVVPLRGLNRAYVAQGLKVLAMAPNRGLAALLALCAKNDDYQADTLGFVLGPMINAPGRLDSAEYSVQLLTCDDDHQCTELAQMIVDMNMRRKECEKAIVQEALAQHNESDPFICAYDEKWHCGVLGIVASRLRERFNKPVFIMGNINGIAKGSCRSVDGIDIAALIRDAKYAGILSDGGGHRMAAGFSLMPGNLERFRDFLRERIHADDIINVLEIDGFLDISEIDIEFVQMIESLAPFGRYNNRANFIVRNVRFYDVRMIKDLHCKFWIVDGSSLQYRNTRFSSIIFNVKHSPFYEIIQNAGDKVFDIVCNLSCNTWNGYTSINMTLEDINYAG